MTRLDIAKAIVRKQSTYMNFENPKAVVKGLVKGAGAVKPQTKGALIAGYYAVNNPHNNFRSKKR